MSVERNSPLILVTCSEALQAGGTWSNKGSCAEVLGLTEGMEGLCKEDSEDNNAYSKEMKL